jgi:CDGSH-type Zn-finger protein
MEKKMTEEKIPCGCGRSATGYCTGLHEMSEEEYEAYLMEHFDEDPDQIGN